MQEITVTIRNESGLHARPAGTFIKLAQQYESNVTIEKDGKCINGKSIFAVMSACIVCGSKITLRVEGPDETQAIQALQSAVESGLGEN